MLSVSIASFSLLVCIICAPGTFASPPSSSSTDWFWRYRNETRGGQSTISHWIGTPTRNFPLQQDVITALPHSGSQNTALTSAMKCWSEIGIWRNESASFLNAKIANRTWSVTSYWATTSDTHLTSSTIYPANVSTYKLCDGSPRANIRPFTTHFTGTTTLSGTFTSTITPTFRPQPCSLSQKDCRLLYNETNALDADEDELLRQCGNNINETPQCIIGGGPVELVYFPVERSNDSLCGNKTTGGVASHLKTDLSEIITLGHTFTSDSVYLSFKTLYATYDGFWDNVGPTFSDLIVPFKSSEISSQCGGWFGAYGPGTPLNYADLNWPVPASAYSCQHRCPSSGSSSAALYGTEIGWLMVDIPPPPECSTIWSDINPVLAVPTSIREMVPEWSSCSFWNVNIANFWFDPPIALEPAAVEAKPTVPVDPSSTPAAPSSTAADPAAPSTRVATSIGSQTTSPPASTATAEVEPKHSSTSDFLISPNEISGLQSAESDIREPAATRIPDADSSQEPDPADNDNIQDDWQSSSTSSGYSIGPAISVLTEALSSFSEAAQQTNTPSTSIDVGEFLGSNAVSFTLDPSPTDKLTGPHETLHLDGSSVLTFDVTSAFAVAPTQENQESTTSASSSHSSTQGEAEDPPATNNSTTTRISQYILQGSDSTTSAESSEDIPYTEVPSLPSGSGSEEDPVTISASVVHGDPDIIAIGQTTLTAGGPAATIKNHIVTKPSSGPLLVDSQTLTLDETLAKATSARSKEHNVVATAGDITITASVASGTDRAILIDGTTLSSGISGLTRSGHTIIYGSSGVALIGAETTRLFHIIKSTTLSPEASQQREVIYALESHTVTAILASGSSNAVAALGTLPSKGGEALTLESMTVTMGSSGLEVVQSDTTVAMSTLAASGNLPVVVNSTWASSVPVRASTTRPYTTAFSSASGGAASAEETSTSSTSSAALRFALDSWSLLLAVSGLAYVLFLVP